MLSVHAARRTQLIIAVVGPSLVLAATQAGPAAASALARPVQIVKAFGHSNCTIVGTDGNDIIKGTPGNDTICAGPGNDIISGGGGSDTIYGDAGNDTITGSNGTVSSASGGDLAGGDQIDGGPGNDTIYGRGGPDWIEGNDGSDRIWGGPGDDLIHGDNSPGEKGTAAGNDLIYGGSGNDSIDGGPGDDQLYAGSNTTVDVVHGDGGNDLLAGSSPSFVDDFWGDSGNDVLIPNPLRLSPLGNDVFGGDGNDVIITFNGMIDGYSAGNDASVPVTDDCTLTVPAERDEAGNWDWSVECDLPFGKGIGDFSLGKDAEGNVTGGAKLADGLLSLSVSSWQKLLNGEASTLEADDVIADPPVPPLFSGDLGS